MYPISDEKLKEIFACLVNDYRSQKTVFNSLNFNPYDDEGVGGYDSVVMERDRYNQERKERISSPIDYGVCETEERAEEISAGAILTDEEEQALNENIFDQDDTLMVVTEMSDGTDSVFAVTVQQIWGQSGLHVTDFIGFFESEAAAQTAIKQADYITYDES